MIRQLLILFLHIELMQNVQNYDLSQLLVLFLVIAVLSCSPLVRFYPTISHIAAYVLLGSFDK